MSEQHKNLLGPYIPQGNVFSETLQQVKLAYNMMLDRRIPIFTKLIPFAALAYLLMPADVIPDVFVGFGQLDDLAILMLGLRTFFEFSPPEVVADHLKRLAQSMSWNVGDKPADKGDVVEGEFRVKNDD